MDRISHWVVPPGGWKFQEGPVLITGQTWDELVKFVRSHRISNKKEIGNVEIEIENKIAENYPELIIDGSTIKK